MRVQAGAALSNLVHCGLVVPSRALLALQPLVDTVVVRRKKATASGSTAAAATGAAPMDVEGEAGRGEQALARRHGGVVGIAALLAACPYAVPAWLPAALVAVGSYVNDPDPIGFVLSSYSRIFMCMFVSFREL